MLGQYAGERLGLAVCKGSKPASSLRSPWSSLCQKWVACPRCENKRASRNASKIAKRLRTEFTLAEGDLEVGVLTWTLPGRTHPIRYGSLREQYDYATSRVRLVGKPGDHSMRGLNKALTTWGAQGGTHFLEFTWNSKKGWWNLHGHSLFWGWTSLDHLKQTTEWRWDPEETILEQKSVPGRRTRRLPRLGLGERYSLDYAEPHELEQAIRYSSKVAYATKPFKAPSSKRLEIEEFLRGDPWKGVAQPRLARPFGDATKPMVQNVLDEMF